MAATEQDFELHKGDTADATITVRDPITLEAKDIAGAAVVFTAIRQATCEEISKVSPTGIDLARAGEGIIKIHFSHDDTKGYIAGRYDYAVTVTDQAGDTCTVTIGVMTIKSLF
jgi:hypothetical protein